MSLQLPSSPQAVHVSAFTVIGPWMRTTNANEMSGNNGKIGPLWSRFMQTDLRTIPEVIDKDTIYAVYTHYASNETGSYDLILGRSVEPSQAAPANMTSIAVPGAEYLVFSVNGSSPDAIKAGWIDVYHYFSAHTHRHRTFTTDFEKHSHRGTQIFIAVR